MRTFLAWILVLGLAGVGVYLLLGYGQHRRADIEGGILDLRNQPLRPNELLPLRGEWMFRKWEEGRYANPVPVQVPGYWNELVIDGERLGPRAIGRYELRILSRSPPGRDAARQPNNLSRNGPPGAAGPRMGPPTLLFLAPFGGAYQVGTKNLPALARDGIIDFQRETSRAGYSHRTLPLPRAARSGDTLNLYVELANHHHHLGGLAQAPLFGFQTAAERFNFWWTLPVIFVGSLLFSFSCLCLGLYLIFRDRAALVYAALFSLVGLLRLLVSDAMPIRFLSTELPLNLVMSLRFLALPYLTFFAGLYVLEFIPQRTTKCFRRFLWWSVSSISGLVLLLPPFPKSYVIYLTQLFIVLTIAFLLWLLLRRSNADNRELRIILFTGILTAVFVLAQVVNFYGNYSARSTQTYGLLVLAGGMGLMALRDVRRLNGERALLTGELQVANTELSQLTRSLESKVAHRTQELAKRNRELETLQRFRQRTNAMIIHDLKNPLQVILSRAGATEGTDGRIRTAGQRMLLMIQNMLDVDRAEQARLTVRPETFLLGDLVRDAVDRQRSFLEQKEISVKVEIPATAKIRSDRNLTERAVDNILHNATKYTPGKGVIRLHVRPEEHFLALYCDDSGPGVPIALREQIFTDYASDRGRSDAYGLGLSFVRIALEAVGGRVAVGTPENGTGGRFVLYFPAAGEAFVQAITLDEQDREVLAPFLPTLRATPFYSATAIEVLLGEIPDVGGLPGWKGALREAMYAGDEDKYLGLLEK